jgi:hypothetical protein
LMIALGAILAQDFGQNVRLPLSIEKDCERYRIVVLVLN